MFEYIDWTPIKAALAEKLKVNFDLWNLFIAIVSSGLTYQERIMTLASTVFKTRNVSIGHRCPRYCQICINRELSLTKGNNS